MDIMADNSGGPVAIVAIIAILILVAVAFYYFTGGTFNFSKVEVNPTKVVTTPSTPSTPSAPSTPSTAPSTGQ